MKKQNIFIVILLLILIILMIFCYKKYQPKDVVVVEDIKPILFNCGLNIDSPTSGQNISTNTGIDIVATLDNTNSQKLGCSWTTFEAQTGFVIVKDANGNEIANPTPLTTTANWMTSSPVQYFGHLNILNNYTGPAFVTIIEENPSDQNPSKTITFPLVITQ